jgi:predicted RNA binding protein YcfA (HicA-like mRNA interferase family)
VSGKLPVVKPKRLLRALEKRGWEVARVTGSHHILVHDDSQGTVSVPLHNRDMRPGTLNRILKDAGIGRDELRSLLK